MKIFNKVTDTWLILSMGIFLGLSLPAVNSIPYLDGNIDFVQSAQFFTEGISSYLENWRSVHPPFKIAVASLFFTIGGLNQYSYNLLGLSFGIIGIATIFFLSKELFGIQIARLSTLLLATSPLFISVGIFSQTDYLLTILILLSLYFYTKGNLWFYSVTSSVAALTKETALLLPTLVLLVELMYSLKKFRPLNFVFLCIPFLIIFSWFWYLKSNEVGTWGDWIFTETASKGSLYTIINNLLTFNFLNKYAYQNWLQLFILNFNWVYWLIVLFGLLSQIKNRKMLGNLFLKLYHAEAKTKTIIIAVMFIFGYFLAVLSFQTYTIPRYGLPIFPFLIIATSIVFIKLTAHNLILKIFSLTMLGIIVFLSLFFSLDPISKKLWKTTIIFSEQFYGLNQTLAGNDGITYNLQYLTIAKKRTKQIQSAKNNRVISNDCYWVFPDPNNDRHTVQFLKLGIDDKLQCTTIHQ